MAAALFVSAGKTVKRKRQTYKINLQSKKKTISWNKTDTKLSVFCLIASFALPSAPYGSQNCVTEEVDVKGCLSVDHMSPVLSLTILVLSHRGLLSDFSEQKCTGSNLSAEPSTAVENLHSLTQRCSAHVITAFSDPWGPDRNRNYREERLLLKPFSQGGGGYQAHKENSYFYAE